VGFFVLSDIYNKIYIMNRSYSKIRHMQESNLRLEGRLLSEQVPGVSPAPTTGKSVPTTGKSAPGGVGPMTGQSNKSGSGGSVAPPVSAPPVSGQGVKVVTPKITIDCAKKLITNSQLPKLADNASNLAMNQALVTYYCSKQ
jgi:hypothetical protein